jgi:hypothetical protein
MESASDWTRTTRHERMFEPIAASGVSLK